MKTRHILALAALIGATSAAQAQLAVIDPALAALSKVSWAKQVVDMTAQIRAAESQLATARSTFDSLNGARGIAGLLRNPTLYNYLPADAAAVLRANGGGIASAAAIRADLQLLDIGKTGLDPQGATAKNFSARQTSNASFQLLNEQGYQASADRIKQLDALTKSIDGATDPMAINALQVRVAAEQALVANEQARLTVLAQMAANAERVREQQSREIAMRATYGTMPAGW